MADLIKYSETDIQRYQELTSSLDERDPSSVLKYGSSMRGIAENVADELLRTTKRSAAGEVGETLSGLLSTIQEVKLTSPGAPSSWKKALIRILPFTRSFLDSFQKFQDRYDTISETFEKIKDTVRQIKEETLEGNSTLAVMYESTLKHRDSLKELIDAGKYRLEQLAGEVDDQRIVAFKMSLENDLRTKEAQCHLLDTTLAQIMIMAQDSNWVCQKADRIVSVVIPNMKSQANMAIRAMKLKYYSGVFEGVDETSNRMITQTAQSVKDASIKLAEQITKEDITIDAELEAVKTTYSTVEDMTRILRDNNSKSRDKLDELARETRRLKTAISERCISETTPKLIEHRD